MISSFTFVVATEEHNKQRVAWERWSSGIVFYLNLFLCSIYTSKDFLNSFDVSNKRRFLFVFLRDRAAKLPQKQSQNAFSFFVPSHT